MTKKDYGIYSPEVERDLSENYTSSEPRDAMAVPPPDPIARLREHMGLEDDSDIPVDVRRALMDCAVHNQRISYYYLCGVYRLGREHAEAHVRDKVLAALNHQCRPGQFEHNAIIIQVIAAVEAALADSEVK